VLLLTAGSAILHVRADVPTVRVQYWIQHEEFLKCDAIAIGKLRARVGVNVFIGVTPVATIDVARLDISTRNPGYAWGESRSNRLSSRDSRIALSCPCRGFALAGASGRCSGAGP
jgi:hypothetical protein